MDWENRLFSNQPKIGQRLSVALSKPPPHLLRVSAHGVIGGTRMTSRRRSFSADLSEPGPLIEHACPPESDAPKTRMILLTVTSETVQLEKLFSSLRCGLLQTLSAVWTWARVPRGTKRYSLRYLCLLSFSLLAADTFPSSISFRFRRGRGLFLSFGLSFTVQL